MKLKNKITYLLLFVSSSFVSSCGDFLDQVNPNNVTSESFYTSISDCESGLAAVYNAYKDTDNYRVIEENLRGDICVEGQWSQRTSFKYPSYMQSFTNSEVACNYKWASLYRGVFNANQLLAGIEKYEATLTNEADKEELNIYKAQAHFFRGLFHYWLSISFNGGFIPIITEVPSDESSLYAEFPKTTEEVVEFYRSEFNLALELGLPDSWESGYEGRVTSGAAKSILGQSYLYENKYEEAKAYFKEVIDSGVYSLSNIDENITIKGEFNCESILEVNYTLDYNTEQTNEDMQLSNGWATMISRNGGSFALLPAGWFLFNCQDDPIDPLNDLNWVEVNLDEDENLIYTQSGVDYTFTTDGVDGAYTITSYVYLLESTDQTEGTYIYGRQLNKLVRSYNADGTLIDNETLAVVYTPMISRFAKEVINVKKVGEKYYRMLAFTPRASYSVAIPGDEDVPYYGGPVMVSTIVQLVELGYFRKLTNWDTYTTEADSPVASKSAINLRLMRLTDVYLMYAECLVQTGGSTQEALDYINKIRYRGGVQLLGESGEYAGAATYDGATYSADEIMDLIMFRERPIELNVEGQSMRVCDLRRWGITKSRFDELAKFSYVVGSGTYVYPTTNGSGLTVGRRWKTIIYTEEGFNDHKDFDASCGNKFTFYDYQNASSNYTDEQNAYWPIPNTEIQSNPNAN